MAARWIDVAVIAWIACAASAACASAVPVAPVMSNWAGPAPAATAPGPIDLLPGRYRQWRLSGSARFLPAPGGPLELRYCCSRDATATIGLPALPARSRVAVRVHTSDCGSAARIRIVVPGAGWRTPPVAEARPDSRGDPWTGVLSLAVPAYRGLDLEIRVQGGRACCGRAVIDSVDLVSEPELAEPRGAARHAMW